MSQADNIPTIHPLAAPTANELAERAVSIDRTIERLKQIATVAAAGAGVPLECPPHADGKLLEVCADLLLCMKHYEAILEEAQSVRHEYRSMGYRATNNQADRSWLAQQEREGEMRRLQGAERSLVSQARKLRATTGAGIYAKALVIRNSQTGMGRLAQSLADDLIQTPSLRASIWSKATEAKP